MSCPTTDYGNDVPNMTENSWNSEPFFRYTSFGGFHRGANDCLTWIFPDYEDYTGYKINPDDILDFDDENVNVDDMIWNNRGPLAFAIIGLIFSAVITIFGIGWCIMQCCSGCGKKKSKAKDRYISGYRDGDQLIGRHGGEESRKEKRIRICCGVTLIVFVLASFASLISLFAMNNQLRDGINGVSKDIDGSLEDIELYLNVTRDQMNYTIVESYSNLNITLQCILEQADGTAMKLSDPATANSSFLKLQEIRTISIIELQRQNVLEIGLNSSRGDIVQFCEARECSNQVNLELTMNMDTLVAAMNKIKHLTQNIQEFATSSVSKLSTATKDQPLNPKSDHTDRLKVIINEQGVALRSDVSALTAALDEVSTNVRNSRQDMKEVESEFDKVNPHLHSAVLVICLFLLLITLTFLFGAIMSFFPPSHKVAKKTKSITLNCGIFWLFLFGGILWIFTMGCFLLSGVLTQVLPGGLRAIENNGTSIENDMPRHHVLAAPKGYENYIFPTYSHIVQNCKARHSAYVTFNLESAYNVSNIRSLPDQFNNGSLRMNSYSSSLHDIASEAPNLMARIKLSKEQIPETMKSLDAILQTVRKLALEYRSDELQKPKEKLEEIYLNELPNVGRSLDSLTDTFNAMSTEFSTMGETKAWFDDFLSEVGRYADFVFTEISENAGECEPMYNALNSTINLFSYKIGSPIAGYWFSLNIVMLLFFPSLITAIVLQRL